MAPGLPLLRPLPRVRARDCIHGQPADDLRLRGLRGHRHHAGGAGLPAAGAAAHPLRLQLPLRGPAEPAAARVLREPVLRCRLRPDRHQVPGVRPHRAVAGLGTLLHHQHQVGALPRDAVERHERPLEHPVFEGGVPRARDRGPAWGAHRVPLRNLRGEGWRDLGPALRAGGGARGSRCSGVVCLHVRRRRPCPGGRRRTCVAATGPCRRRKRRRDG
mmetsp:Transcript_79830/g.234818  ORF Transcript_79830/g.234818 Transcript_79830/m.234818 type:complete len:217 (+) Transcript_79830:147-797(+)